MAERLRNREHVNPTEDLALTFVGVRMLARSCLGLTDRIGREWLRSLSAGGSHTKGSNV